MVSWVHPSLSVIQIRNICMAVSPPKPYCRTHKRHMYGSQCTHTLLSNKQETNVWQSVHSHLTVKQTRDTCMAVSAPTPYCQTNKRQMYGSQCTHTLLSNKQETNVWQSAPTPYCQTNKRYMYGSQCTHTLLSNKQETNVW